MNFITMAADEDQFRVNIDTALKGALDGIFERQGTSQKEGTTRLFKWFVSLDPDLQALILGQVHGAGRTALIHAIMERLKGEPSNAVAESGGGTTKTRPLPSQGPHPSKPHRGHSGSAR